MSKEYKVCKCFGIKEKKEIGSSNTTLGDIDIGMQWSIKRTSIRHMMMMMARQGHKRAIRCTDRHTTTLLYTHSRKELNIHTTLEVQVALIFPHERQRDRQMWCFLYIHISELTNKQEKKSESSSAVPFQVLEVVDSNEEEKRGIKGFYYFSAHI